MNTGHVPVSLQNATTYASGKAGYVSVCCLHRAPWPGQLVNRIPWKKKKIQKTSHYGGTERRYAYKSDPSRAYSSSLPLFWSHIDTLVLSIKAPGEPKFYTILPYVIASWFIVPCLTLKSSWPGGRCIHTLPSSTGLCP